jgi:hypothetical protein
MDGLRVLYPFTNLSSQWPHPGIGTVIYDSLGVVYKTNNGGVTWDAVLNPIVKDRFFTAFFSNSTKGWAAGETSSTPKVRVNQWSISKCLMNLQLKSEIFFLLPQPAGPLDRCLRVASRKVLC